MKTFNPFAALVALAFMVGAMFAPVVQADLVQDPAGETSQVQFDGGAGGDAGGGDWEGDWEDDDDDDDEEDEWEGDW